MSLEVGSVVEGLVTGITNFGVFIKLPGGETGLVHISEIADTYVKDINDYIKKRDKVKVKVLSIDKGGKIGLSIKQVNEKSSGKKNQQ
ncbi:MAG: S1 RNA-binding domain-containing protein, partial [Candidatus Syntrophonatronum acetioxidans]